jgi:hypothetical protein
VVAVSASRCERRASGLGKSARPFLLSLPLDPAVDPSTCLRARLIPRSAELDYSRIGLVSKADKKGPFVAPEACANDVLNLLVMHGAKEINIGEGTADTLLEPLVPPVT